MKIAQDPEKFFNQNQFLLADSAYTSNQYTLPDYKGKDLQERKNIDFNYRLAQSHVRIKHAIGNFKGRFSSLREIWSQICNFHEMKGTIKWIISCIILNNLLANQKDQWNDLYEEDIPEPPRAIADEKTMEEEDGIRGWLCPIAFAHYT